jgi:hypothetical protein
MIKCDQMFSKHISIVQTVFTAAEHVAEDKFYLKNQQQTKENYFD